MARLAGIGYEGFEYTENGFTAYIPERDFDTTAIEGLELAESAPACRVEWTTEEVKERDWNKEWEEHFTPITVEGRIVVRAGFHPAVPDMEYEIIIEPKMSFGTGHHATTALMLGSILELKEELAGKRVLDMGCGTGILSIMASKAGASDITGIDIDEWAYNNAGENILLNRCTNIRIKIGDASLLAAEAPFDLILANINRNILLADMERYVARLIRGGQLVMSGFYTEDLPLIRQKAEALGLTYRGHKTEQNWVAATFLR